MLKFLHQLNKTQHSIFLVIFHFFLSCYTLRMTDDELLVDSYKKILEQVKENSKYLSKDKYEYTKESTDECADLTAILSDILPEITGLESMNALDEEDYAFMYEMLDSYAENFIVDGRNPETLQKDTETYEQLMDILAVLEKNYVPQDYNPDEEDED